MTRTKIFIISAIFLALAGLILSKIFYSSQNSVPYWKLNLKSQFIGGFSKEILRLQITDFSKETDKIKVIYQYRFGTEITWSCFATAFIDTSKNIIEFPQPLRNIKKLNISQKGEKIIFSDEKDSFQIIQN